MKRGLAELLAAQGLARIYQPSFFSSSGAGATQGGLPGLPARPPGWTPAGPVHYLSGDWPPRCDRHYHPFMQLFIDTANLAEIRQAADMGVLDGVTTNPSLIAREKGVDYNDRLAEICEVVAGPVSAEVVALDHDGMIKEAEPFTRIADNIVIKLPCTVEGLKACKTLSDRGVKTNMTLCFQPLQAMLVAKAGASIVSPFVGRIDDVSGDGMELIQQIRNIYDNYGYDTKILAASIRHPLHLVQAALIGADIATVPFEVIAKMMNHPLTDVGIEKFLADWKKAQQAMKPKQPALAR